MAIKSVSKNCIELIKQFEGCKLTAYQDCVGVWTIGYGTTSSMKSVTGKNITKGMTISQATADDWLMKSVNQRFLPNINKYYDKYKWTQNQADALVSFAYNIGSIDGLVGKGTKSIVQISKDILLYNKAKGIVYAGLTRRREAEKKLFDLGSKVSSDKKEDSKTVIIPKVSLQKGSQGASVSNLQSVIAKYFDSAVKVDGDYGNKTKNGVIKMQKVLNVKQDGEYGPKTRDALKKYLEAKKVNIKVS